MTVNIYKRALVKEFVDELGTLLAIRISRYHRNFNKSNEIEFFNEFIICPSDDDDGEDLIRNSARIKKHFDKNFVTGFSQFQLAGLSLNSQKEIEYALNCYPDFLEEDYQGDSIAFALAGKAITFYDQYPIDLFEEFGDEVWSKLILDVKKEISFGSLKDD